MECTVTIPNPLGLHARAAAKFVHAAGRFTSRVRVIRGDREMDGKSIMGLLLLAASQGTSIRIATDGPDEAAAMETLCRLVAGGFDEVPVDEAQGSPFDPARDTPCD